MQHATEKKEILQTGIRPAEKILLHDLDFSLQAFRLRIEYFFQEPIDEKTFSDGLAVWFFRRQMNAEREH